MGLRGGGDRRSAGRVEPPATLTISVLNSDPFWFAGGIVSVSTRVLPGVPCVRSTFSTCVWWPVCTASVLPLIMIDAMSSIDVGAPGFITVRVPPSRFAAGFSKSSIFCSCCPNIHWIDAWTLDLLPVRPSKRCGCLALVNCQANRSPT
jgi:hypothetical protein